MKESRKQFIREAYEAACSDWKEKIKAEFPNLFKDEFKVGAWVAQKTPGYYDWKDNIIMVSKVEDDRVWTYNNTNFNLKESGNLSIEEANLRYRKATTEEIESHLISEAKNRGYANGNFKCMSGAGTVKTKCEDYFYMSSLDGLYKGEPNNANAVYYQGQWAEIINPVPVELRDLIEKYGKEELKKWL